MDKYRKRAVYGVAGFAFAAGVWMCGTAAAQGLTHPMRVQSLSPDLHFAPSGVLHVDSVVPRGGTAARPLGIAEMLQQMPVSDLFLRKDGAEGPLGGLSFGESSAIGLSAGRAGNGGGWQGGIAVRLGF